MDGVEKACDEQQNARENPHIDLFIPLFFQVYVEGSHHEEHGSGQIAKCKDQRNYAEQYKYDCIRDQSSSLLLTDQDYYQVRDDWHKACEQSKKDRLPDQVHVDKKQVQEASVDQQLQISIVRVPQ